jgi:hypothetical protein
MGVKMKKWNFLVQVSLLAIISIYQTMTYAAKPLFKVSFIQNNVGNDGYMTIRTTTPNFVYPYAGIQFNSDDIVMNQGCIKNPVNGWCLFPVSDTAPNVLQVSLPNKSLMRSQLTINMALNAKGKNPVSVQQMTVSTQSPGRVIGYLYGWETPPLIASEWPASFIVDWWCFDEHSRYHREF